MRKYTLKEIKGYIKDGLATDITNYSFKQANDLRNRAALDKVGYSTSRYGLNGCIVQDTKTGEMYAVTARNSTLFQIW